jgi:exopolysaccharide biosynthesis polyprenyl glycosylphosphotransferase
MATQPTEPVPRPGSSSDRDVRALRLYVLQRGALRTFVRRAAAIVSLAVLDAIGLALGIYLALVLRSVVYGEPVLWSLLWRFELDEWLPFLVPITLLVFWQAGLYASRERRAGLGRVASSLVLVAAIVLAFGYGTGYDFNTTGLIPTAVVLSAATVGLLRAAYDSSMLELQRILHARRRALLLGDAESNANLRRMLSGARGGLAYEFVEAPLSPEMTHADRVALARPDEVILTEGDFDEETVLEIVETAHRLGVKVRIAPKTTELLIERGEYVPGQGMPLFELRPPVLAGADWAMKRTFDLAVSALVLLVGTPLWLLIALAIKLDSRGPILYRDRRIGVRESAFGMLKFRTMVRNADVRQQELEERNEAAGALFKIRRDPRVTRVGSVLRRLSLDEMPQLLNVLRGEMSLVGPRPLPVRDYEKLEAWHRKRYLVLPGITGLWQISGRSNLTFDDLVRLDFYYIENWSIWLDLSILIKTPVAIFSGRGAY